MVEKRDPTVIPLTFLTILKFWHTFAGLYIWEVFTTLDYEWSVFRGRRPYRWTVWLYSFTRWATLMVIVLLLLSMNAMTPCRCEILPFVQITFSYLASAAATLLLVLRVIAIWNKAKVAMAIAICLWLTNIAILIHGATEVHVEWVPDQATCVMPDIKSIDLDSMIELGIEILLLSIVLVGLLRLRREGGGRFGLGQLLWKQGIIWLLLSLAVEVLQVVFFSLEIDGSLNAMLQPPALIITSITATRMHRSLADFAFQSTDFTSSGFKPSGLPVWKAKWTPATQHSLGQMQVAVHISSEGPCGEYPNSRGNSHGSCIGVDGQLHSGTIAPIVGSDLEKEMSPAFQ